MIQPLKTRITGYCCVISYVLALLLLSIGTLGAHDGHDHSEINALREHAKPLQSALRIKFGETMFTLGPMGSNAKNTIILTRGEPVSIPLDSSPIRKLAILHTGLHLPDGAECRVGIQYEGAEELVYLPWNFQDWQAKAERRTSQEAISGLWWYRHDKGLVTDDANAKLFVDYFDADPGQRIQSIQLDWLHMPEKADQQNESQEDLAPSPEFRVYAVSMRNSGTLAWKSLDLSRLFNADTILSETIGLPSDDRMYFATEWTERLANHHKLTGNNNTTGKTH